MGLIKSILRFKLYAGLVATGYLLHSCISADQRYRIQRYNNKPNLVDKRERRSLEIYVDSFQVGSPKYRILGLLREPNLRQAIEEAQQELEANK